MDQTREELEHELLNIKQRIRNLREAQRARTKSINQKKLEELPLTLEYVVKEDAIKYLKDNNLSFEYLPKAFDVLAAKHDYLNIRPNILMRYFHCTRHKTKFANFEIVELIDKNLSEKCEVVLWHHKALRRKAFKKYTPKRTCTERFYDENGWPIRDKGRSNLTYEDIMNDYSAY